MEKIVIANAKGGVAKTTTVVNLSSILSEKGLRVLAIDLDSQSHLTLGLGVDIAADIPWVGDVFEGKRSVEEAVIGITKCPNLHILASKNQLGQLEHVLEKKEHRKYQLLKDRLKNLSGYDVVLIDTGPAAFSLLTLNGLIAADYVLMTSEPSHYSVVGCGNITMAITYVRKESLNRDLTPLGILITRYEKNTESAKQIEILRSVPGFQVFKNMIRKNVALTKSSSAGKPINLFDKKSNGYKNYRDFSEELLQYLGSNIYTSEKIA